jgi:hypothetical protein
MVLSSFIISTGIYRVLSKPFSVISRYVFRIPPTIFSIFLLSLVAGYPVGAKLLASSVSEKKIDKDTAADMQNYCYSGGPAFFCGVVSVSLFNNIIFGLIIFAVVFLSNILSAIIVGRSREIPQPEKIKAKIEINVRKFLSAVTDGGKSILILCGIIVFFSTFNCLLEKLGFITILSRFPSRIFDLSRSDSENALRSIVEITNIMHFTPGNVRIFPLLTALLSFGGFCVIMQVFQFAGGFISPARFLFHRAFTAIISYVFANIALIFFPALTAVAANTVNGGFTKGTVLPSILLIFMSIILFTFDIHRKRRIKRLTLHNNILT